MKKILLLSLSMILLLVVLYHTPIWDDLLNHDLMKLSETMTTFGWLAVLVSIGLIILQTFFPFIPFFLLAGVNVLLFGLLWGFLLSWMGAVLGAVISFFLSRNLLKEWAYNKVGHLPFYRTMNDHAKKDGFFLVLLGRFIPVIPSSGINLAAGLSNISFLGFFSATLLGKLPITFLETLFGHDLLFFQEHKGRLLIVSLLLALLVFAGYMLRRSKVIKN